MSFEQQWTWHLAHLLAKQRCGGSVYMDGSHNPKPTEYQEARKFVIDLLDSFQGKF